MAKIISHNTFSCLPVRQWWLRPFAFMARCQSGEPQGKDLDIRIRFNRITNEPVFAHGLMEYKGDVYATLRELNKRGCTTRVLLETTPFMGAERRKDTEMLFYFFCHCMEYTYRNIRFWGGWPRDKWCEKIYTFDMPDLDIEEHHGSVSGNLLNCLRLRAWAKRHNREALAGCRKGYCMIDFVEYR